MNFKCSILSDRSQTDKATYLMISFISYTSEKAKLYKQNEISVCPELKVGEKVTTNKDKKN